MFDDVCSLSISFGSEARWLERLEENVRTATMSKELRDDEFKMIVKLMC